MRILKLCFWGLAVMLGGIAHAQQAKLNYLKDPQPFPNTSFYNGKESADLKKYRGKYVLINFWATWCSPCVSEMPSLDKMAARTQRDNLVVIAVSEDEGGSAEAQPFTKKLGLKYITLLYDPKKKGFKELGLKGLPTTFIVNPQGEIIATIEGAASWHEGPLFEQIMTIIKKQPR